MGFTFRTLAAMCAISLGLSGCTNDSGSSSGEINTLISNTSSEQISVEGIQPPEESVIAKQPTCKIVFSEGEIKAEGNGARIDGSVVRITSAGVYTLSGKSSDAKILIEADKADVKLLLNGVELTSKSGAVIDCEDAKLLTLCVMSNTKNSVSDTANYTFSAGEDEPDAAVFSRSDTIITGGGELAVNGSYKDAIKCKDGLTIGGGTLAINAADDGITGKDYVVVYGGDITVVSGGDGIKSTNSTDEGRGYVTIAGGTISVESEKDGIQAETLLTVSDGDIKVKAGGEEANAEIVNSERDFFDWDNRGDFHRGGMPGNTSAPTAMQNTSSGDTAVTDTESVSCKGLKAGGNISITGGTFDVLSADDSIHSNAAITIEKGELTLSSCDDGIHADDALTIKDGTINITKSYEGLEGKNISINGGRINVNAVDDGLNAAGGDNAGAMGFNGSSDEYYISVSGGEIVINASSGDGLDSNGTIAQTGGSLIIYGPENNNNSAIDYEGSYALSGGTLVALGSRGMAQAPSALSQPCLSIYANAAKDSVIEVRDSSGKTIISVTTPKACQSLIFSCKEMVSGNEYSIYAGETLLQTVTATDGVAGGGASGSGFGGGHGGFGGGHGGFDRGDFDGSLPEGMTPPDGTSFPDGTSRPTKPGRFADGV